MKYASKLISAFEIWISTSWLMFHWTTIIMILLQFANNHFFKPAAVGSDWAIVTGKLSGLSGTYLQVAIFEVFLGPFFKKRINGLYASCLIAAIIAILFETSPVFVEFTTNVVQTLYNVLKAGKHRGYVMDLTDLTYLIAIIPAFFIGRRLHKNACE
ncbi:MAG: hypothetical protein NT027_14385 [Proteobacteria bacterium]|nr:hypothetical protein [Pseudomonadota bacterium]